jgi:hypothetical protein
MLIVVEVEAVWELDCYVSWSNAWFELPCRASENARYVALYSGLQLSLAAKFCACELYF